jgi:hypothetical protein
MEKEIYLIVIKKPDFGQEWQARVVNKRRLT